MYKRLKEHIQKNNLFNIEKNKLLIAVSGGVDSVVMLDLISRLGVQGAIAHCNFNLRGKESDEDELLVEALAKHYKLPIFCKLFNTENYAQERGISIQMAARELRYQWFEELRIRNGLDYIALAQHRDDRIETFFINLNRGTGVSGLDSIWVKRDCLLRPLLYFGKDEIKAYADRNKLKFREDSSNLSDKYIRNKIRHQIIPLFKEINPDFEQRMEKNLNNFRFADRINNLYFSQLKNDLLKKQNNRYEIDVVKIIDFRPLEKYLFNFLKDFSFSPQTCTDIAEALVKGAQSGKVFYSDKYILIIDRGKLIIQKLKPLNNLVYEINESPEKIIIDKRIEFTFETLMKDERFKLLKKKHIAMLDKSKLHFPLIIRNWKEGDFFHPLGMKGRKKISDYLIDNKVSLLEKKEVLVVISGEDVVWVVGQRVDDRYKVTEKTNNVFVIYAQSLPSDNL